jgi:hypothetical protein
VVTKADTKRALHHAKQAVEVPATKVHSKKKPQEQSPPVSTKRDEHRPYTPKPGKLKARTAVKPAEVKPVQVVAAALESKAVSRIEKFNRALDAAAKKFGAPPDIVAAAKAIIYQESRGRNLSIHADGQGRGLIGLDPTGELPKFEDFVGGDYGPNDGIPAAPQLAFLVKRLVEFKESLGNVDRAIRSWHRPGKPDDEHADAYSRTIRRVIENWAESIVPAYRPPNASQKRK